jgi:type III restriction enzyme
MMRFERMAAGYWNRPCNCYSTPTSHTNADGQPVQGKFAMAFEATLAELAQEERYRELDWLKLPIPRLYNGYFAQDKNGVLKDTRGNTQADDEVYNLIMKDKERLLSLDEPLRFIFSHSALREGWDNPNVFQICTLNETRSTVKKRQEIGRGLRLPVDQSGQRVFDASVNRLFVVANESLGHPERGWPDALSGT